MAKLISFSLIVLVLLSISTLVYADDPCAKDDVTCDDVPPVTYSDGQGCFSFFVLVGASGGGLYFERKKIDR
jgi:hypothetical protein